MSKGPNVNAALKALAQRSSEPLCIEERNLRIGFLKSALDAIGTGKVAESQWTDLLIAVEVCRRVIQASRHDQASIQRVALLQVEIRHARNMGSASVLRKQAAEEVADLYIDIINNCPAPLFERCEMQAHSHGSK